MIRYLELYDACRITVETEAKTVDEFLNEVLTRYDDVDGLQFLCQGDWLPAIDLEFVPQLI